MKRFKYYDFLLIFSPLILVAFGILMIYSASMVTAVVENGESTYYMVRQLIWFGIGLVAFIFFSLFPYRYYPKLMKIIVLAIIVMLVAVLLFGNTVNNARSWFAIGPLSLQPAEFAKLVIIMYIASVYSKKQDYINDFNKGVLPPLVLTSIMLLLIVMQPDIGTAAIVFLIACTVILGSGIRRKHLTSLILVGAGALLLLLPFLWSDERISRFTGAYQPFEAPQSDGYQLIQSYVSIGTGGLTGTGLGEGVQKLGYLMEAHTDFIMAVIAEELGFIGVAIVLGLLGVIVLRGLLFSRKCKDSFGALLALGISSMVGIQTFINLGAITGLLPITGVPLPFVSYGGSSLLVMLISMGILNNIVMTVKKEEDGPRDGIENVSDNTGVRYLNSARYSKYKKSQ